MEEQSSASTYQSDFITSQHSVAVLGNRFIIGFEPQSHLGENYILIVVVVEIQKLDSDLFVSKTPTTTSTTTTLAMRTV